MKVVSLLFALVAIAVAAPANPDADAIITKQVHANDGIEEYHLIVKTSNGIDHEEQIQLVNPGSENESISTRGTFKYIGPDGVEYKVNYIADENGFQPSGDHLPK